MWDIEAISGGRVWLLRPLIAAYFRTTPQDPWANIPEECLAWWELVSEGEGGLVLMATLGDEPMGFCVAEILRDEPNRTRCCMVYAAYAAPIIRSSELRDETLRRLKAHARAHGATYLSTFAARGRALARWLGWKYAGDHMGRAYLLGRIAEGVRV